jgi:hypothetical protein
MTEPLPVLPLEYAPPAPAVHRRWCRIARACAVVAWPCCLFTWALVAAGNVQTVLVGGPVIFVLGLLVLLGGIFGRNRWFVGVGVGHCAVCVLFLFLVNALHWGPPDARVPFTIMGAAYTLAAAAPTAIALKARPPSSPRERSTQLPQVAKRLDDGEGHPDPDDGSARERVSDERDAPHEIDRLHHE